MKSAQIVLINNGLILGVSRKDNHSSFSLPGGKMEAIDNDSYENTAIRECFEETGIKPFNLRLIYHRENSRTFLADFDINQQIDHNEPHVVEWVTKEVILNGSFKDYNIHVVNKIKELNINLI
jgi:8-oxo-dGTP pyrophosphatase MutT (NUDIX family)